MTSPDGILNPNPATAFDARFWQAAGTGASYGEEKARTVAYWVQIDLERRYPDSVNARCVAMAGESNGMGILAVTWMRGREVFHRRHDIDAISVGHHGAHHFASYLLPTILRQIDTTEGAERP